MTSVISKSAPKDANYIDYRVTNKDSVDGIYYKVYQGDVSTVAYAALTLFEANAFLAHNSVLFGLPGIG